MALKEKVGREMAENTTLTTESEDDHSIEEQSEASDLLDYEDKSKEELIQEAIEYREALEKRGVIYMSRVPPFMKPNKARSIFEQYGEVTRLFLAEEDAQHRKKRKEHGGNASKQFCEGWIEFSDKKVAKRVAKSLNNSSMGGKKSDYYHDDIWNLKYLKNFKWEFLTEKLAYERRVREAKLKTALVQSKKDNAEMKDLIEKTKVQEIVQKRQKRKREEEGGGSEAVGVSEAHKRPSRKFKQNQSLGRQYDEQSNQMDRAVLKSIFAKNAPPQ